VRIVAVVLGLVTVAALDLILLAGAGDEPPVWFGILVLVMDVSLLASSVTLGTVLLARGRRLLGALFLGNLAVMLGALVLRTSGVEFPRAVPFGADVYWLNLYLLGLVVCIREGPDTPNQAPHRAGGT
jgi:hypothetical protein